MISPLAAGLSAISAFSKKMGVTANNVANVTTDGFKKSRTLLVEGKSGGVQASVDQVDAPGFPRQIDANGSMQEVETSNVDLAEEFGETITTQTAYTANIKTIQTHDRMIGSLLDIIG